MRNPNTTTDRRRPSRSGRLLAVALLVGSFVVAGCSLSGPGERAVPDLTADELTDWLGLAAEVVSPCHESVSQADAELEAFVAAGVDAQLALPTLLAAGAAVEQCAIDQSRATAIDGLRATFPDAADLVAEWMAAAELTSRELLVAAAGNSGSRLLVGNLVEQMRVNDLIGEDLTDLAVAAGERSGVDASTYILHRWDPPNH